MSAGVLHRTMRLRDKKGRITLIESCVLVHMTDPHCTAIRYTITPENYSAPVTVRSGIDGSVQNTGVARYRELNSKHYYTYTMGSFSHNGMYLAVKTNNSDIYINEAASLAVYTHGRHPSLGFDLA